MKIIIILIVSFIVGFVLGENKYYYLNYWDDLNDFLDSRDKIIISRLNRK